MTRPDHIAPTTIFERTSRLAQQLGAINLGQGFPDFPEPPELIEAARAALSERSNQYPPMRGVPELRRAIAAWYGATQGLAIDEAEVVVTSGATEALAASIFALVAPGDEVVLVQPLYDAYLPLVARAGGIPRLIDLKPPDWSLPLDALAAAIGPRTRLLVLNTPNNPTGAALDRATLEQIAALCERHDVHVLCDEVWEAMLFGGATHLSPMAIDTLRARTVKIGSAGKIFSLTGWKVGWAIGAPPLADRIAAQHQYLTFTTPPALQWAVAAGLQLPDAWFAEHRQRYAAARARLVAGLGDAGYAVLPNAGAWFVNVDLAASGLPASDAAIADQLVREAGVAVIPLSAFYAERPEPGYLRFCFAKTNAALDDAIARLDRFRKAAA